MEIDKDVLESLVLKLDEKDRIFTGSYFTISNPSSVTFAVNLSCNALTKALVSIGDLLTEILGHVAEYNGIDATLSDLSSVTDALMESEFIDSGDSYHLNLIAGCINEMKDSEVNKDYCLDLFEMIAPSIEHVVALAINIVEDGVDSEVDDSEDCVADEPWYTNL